MTEQALAGGPPPPARGRIRGIRRLFFVEQAKNRRRTAWLFVVLLLLLALMGWAVGVYFESPVFGLGLGMVVAAISWGGAQSWGVAGVLRGAKAGPLTSEDRARLAPLMEGLRIAAGRAKPVELYVVEDPAPNAFAVSKGDEAAVTVTRGLLERLDKYELEAVLAHELAHVENGDSRLMVLVAAIVGSILMLSELVWRSMFWGGGRRRSRRSGGDGGNVLILVLMLLALVIAPLAAQWVRFAVSRSREFLADATAVKLTRNPDGLIAALEKIKGDDTALQVAHLGSAHLWIWNPLREHKGFWTRMMETHPPMSERINRLRGM